VSEPVTSERVDFDGAGVRLAGEQWAAAPSKGVLLLLHGGGQTRHSWKRTAARLAQAGWTTITLDTRGHGDSGWASDGDYSMDALVGDLRAVAAQLAESPIVIGASMGGLTALVSEGERPGGMRALVLVDVAPRVEQAGSERIQAFMRGAPDGFASLEEVADAVAAYNPHRPRPKSVDGLRKNVRLHADGRWYWHWDPVFVNGGDEPRRALSPERFYAAARSIHIPTLLIRGQLSDILSPEGAAEVLEMIPGAGFVDVAGTGHMVAGDDNDVFTEALTDFLSDVVAGDSPHPETIAVPR
jgi:pimeloyl-ACP methyl ester carboxylesterase